MSANLETSTPLAPAPESELRYRLRKFAVIVGEPIWVVLCLFGFSAGLVLLVMALLPMLSVASETTTGQLVTNAIIYMLAAAIVLIPLRIRKVSWPNISQLLGVSERPKLAHLAWTLPAFVIYFLTAVLVSLAAANIPGFDSDQAQNVGFDDVTTTAGYVMAFVGLVVLPPIFEEVLFRGYLFGRLRKYAGFWFSTIVTSLAFGIVHLQWNVGIDTFVLSIFLCFLREHTKSLWAPILLHAIKNGLAYFFIFIAPLLGLNLV